MEPGGSGRMAGALSVLGCLALAAGLTRDPGKYRSLTGVLLAFFAFRVVLGRVKAR